jgi:ABC-type transport system involved in multi-copper enzyme maturation permease subunit
MNRILAIAGNTFRENIRDKILYNLILFALIMILSSLVIGQLTLGHETKVILDLGLTSISVFGMLIAIFIGIGLVYKELEKRTIYVLIAKPVHRHELILGKYLGLLFTLFINVVFMTVGMELVLLFWGGAGPDTFLRLIPAVYLIFLSLALITALALLFSTFSSPVLSALFTFFLWVIGHFNSDLRQLGRITKSVVVDWTCRILYYVLPNFENFEAINSQNVIQTAAYSQPLNFSAIGWVTGYRVLYCTIIVVLAIAIFSRRDFK